MNKNRAHLPKSLYTASQTRDLDLIAMQEFSMGDGLLMERAGLAGFQLLKEYWPACHRILFICGPGNNGGDGFVMARLAKQAGLWPTVVLFGSENKLSGDAAKAAQSMKQAGVSFHPYDASLFQQHDVIVDALFGTGLDRKIQGQGYDVIQQANQHGEIISLDLPSGLNADTGSVLGIAIRAKVTVSFIGLKQGLLTANGPDYCGELYFNDLAVPSAVYDRFAANAQMLLPSEWLQYLQPRKKSSHKGDHGHALIIGGNLGMSGAVLLAGMAALRSGAGLVSIACHPDYASSLNMAQPELMVTGVKDGEALIPLLDKCDDALLGPGLGQDSWAKDLFDVAIKHERVSIIDADGLNLLAQQKRKGNWCLTPHPGEAGRLLNMSSQDVQANRFRSVKELEKSWGGNCVLKGAGSLVFDQKLGLHLCHYGNPGMATGGMGDVLGGIMLALLVQGHTMSVASRLAVLIHALAGDSVAKSNGPIGMVASDLFPHVMDWINGRN